MQPYSLQSALLPIKVYFDNLSPSRATDFEWEVGLAKSTNNGTGRHDMGNFIVGTVKQQVQWRSVFSPVWVVWPGALPN